MTAERNVYSTFNETQSMASNDQAELAWVAD